MALSMGFLRQHVAAALFGLMCLFAADAKAVTIAWSPIGNAGNAADPATGFGAVGYDYKIGTYDVTNAQYTEFLNAKDPNGVDTLKLYDSFRRVGEPNNGISFNAANATGSKYTLIPGLENHPVNDVTWFSAIRFANWINNGQGNADTENGAYTLLGGTPSPSNSSTIARNPTARVALPTENEWYKAAYYDPASHSYFQYPTSSNTAPSAVAPPSGSNSANYLPAVGTLSDVGAYSLSLSPYHTFDQGGNAHQWLESVAQNGIRRVFRGGAYSSNAGDLKSSTRFTATPGSSGSDIGFRLVQVPEPSAAFLALFACASFILWLRIAR